jgi:hypothetical protein
VPSYHDRLRQLTRELRAARLDLSNEIDRVAKAESGSDPEEKTRKRKKDGKKVKDCTKIKLRHGHASNRKDSR